MNRLRVISLGAGVQSSTMLLMASRGEIKADAAVFADTGGEPKAVYDWLEFLKSQSPFPIVVASRGNLWKAATNVRVSKTSGNKYIQTAIPVFTVDGLRLGKGQRHCTRDYKVHVVQREARKLLGKARVTRNEGVLVDMLIGISTDEAHRMKPSRESWIANEYPLIDMNYSRTMCEEWCLKHYGRVPPRSACTYCPFRSDEQWAALAPEEFRDAVQKEKQLQAAYLATEGTLTSVPYLHSSRVPLDQVKLSAGKGRAMIDKFGNECEGLCGV